MTSMPKSPLIARDYLQAVVRIVRRTGRFWWVALLACAIGIAGTCVAVEIRQKQFRSEAVVYYQEGLQWTANEGMSTRRIGQRLKDLLLARTQLARLIDELGLFPTFTKAGRTAEAVEEMRAATTFKVSEGDIFVIGYTGDSPEEAQRVTAKLTDVLIGENTRLRSEQAEVARAFLDVEKKRNEADLNAKETAQLRFLAQHPEFAHEQSTIGQALRASNKRGTDAALASATLSSKDDNALGALRREEERLRRQISNPGEIPRARRDPVLLAAKTDAETKLRAAQRELADRKARFTEQHPDVRSAAGIVKEAEDAFRRASDALVASDVAAPPVEVEPRAALEARLAAVREDIAAYQRKHPKEKIGPDEPVETSDAAQRIVAIETEWARLSREVTEAKERFQQLDTKQFMASMTASTLMSGQAAQILVIDPAFVPTQPNGMSSKRMYLMGFLLALGFGLGLAMMCALLDDRVYDHVDVERLELAPVLIEVTRRSMQERKAAA